MCEVWHLRVLRESQEPGCETAENQCRHAKPNNNTDIYFLSSALPLSECLLSSIPLIFIFPHGGSTTPHLMGSDNPFMPPTQRLTSFLFSFPPLHLLSILFWNLLFFPFCEGLPWVKLHCFTNSIKRLINNLGAGQFSEQSFFLWPTGNPAKASKCCSNRPWITINPAWLDLPIVIPVLRERDRVRARLETAGVEKRDNRSERERERMI